MLQQSRDPASEFARFWSLLKACELNDYPLH
jgi:hypothetical protein